MLDCSLLRNWLSKGRYLPLSEGLSNLFENLICHKQSPTIIDKMSRLIKLIIEERELFNWYKMRRKKFDFKVIGDLILNEQETLTKRIEKERTFFDRVPRGISDNLPILSSNHGFSYAILKDLQEKGNEPEIVIVIDGHFDFYAYLTVPKIQNFVVSEHIDRWANEFDSRQELIAFLQAHEDKHYETSRTINSAEWLKNCFFNMPNTNFIHIGADWKDTKFQSNEFMKSVYKMDIYPHLYSDLIKWSEKDIKIRELKKLIQNRRIYLSIDVDGIAGVPSTYSLAESTRRNQISKTTFKNILRSCGKYAKDIKFDVSELSLHGKQNITEELLKHVFTTLQ